MRLLSYTVVGKSTAVLSTEEEIKRAIGRLGFTVFLFEKNGFRCFFAKEPNTILLLDGEAFNACAGLIEKNKAKKPPFKELLPNFTGFAPALSTDCGLACTYCFCHGGEKRKTTSPDWKQVKTCLDFLYKPDQKVGLVITAPGEQTKSFELLKKTVACMKEKNMLGTLEFSTNGMIDGKTIDWISANIPEPQVSCDGPPEIQDAQRPLSGGGGSSRIVEATIRKFAAKGRPFKTRLTLTEKVFGREKEIFAYFYDLSSRHIGLGPLMNFGRAHDSWRESPEKETLAIGRFADLCAEFGVAFFTGSVNLLREEGTRHCPLGSLFCMGADGAINACEMYASQEDLKHNPGLAELSIGRYDAASSRIEIDEKKISEFRGFRERVECKKCDFKLCWGDCPLASLHKNRSILKPDKAKCLRNQRNFRALAEQVIEREVIALKPFIRIGPGSMTYCTSLHEFPLETAQNNIPKESAFVSLEPENFSFVSELKKIKKMQKTGFRFYLFSPTISEKTTKKDLAAMAAFFMELEKENMLFNVTKPLPPGMADLPERLLKRIPKDCFECREMFSVQSSIVVFCNGAAGKKLEKYPDRHALFEDFLESAERKKPDCYIY
ncbi:MAG: hypothetical protein NT067_05480 [Candidatus Diapherotrites archaeon]|nr:hypothetical protein [Candidatus Diapherotrites archaeon]